MKGEVVKPALSPEEWRGEFSDGRQTAYRGSGDHEGEGLPLLDDGRVSITYDSGCVWTSVPESERHRLAALALYGQTFGFGQLDVDTLREIAKGANLTGFQRVMLHSVAYRIADLLPPLSASPASED